MHISHTDIQPLVDVRWLSDRIGGPHLRIVDCRWSLMDAEEGHRLYLQGHIPGAVFVDVHRGLAGEKGPGRHPLPSASAFEALMRAFGVSAETHVVAYDDAGGPYAARLWWLLGYFGHSRASVLDGGIGAWMSSRRPVTPDIPVLAPGSFIAQPQAARVVDRVGVAQRSPDVVLIDARAPERFRGDLEPIDVRPGHIPGAQSFPYADNLVDGRFRTPEELRARFAAVGISTDTPVIHYCGSGVTACHNLLAARVAGLPAGLLYEGSWSDWVSEPSAPASLGPSP